MRAPELLLRWPEPESESAVDNSDHDAQLARLVLSYFLRQPESADSVEGIARFRLLEEQVYQTIEETQRALDLLVSRKLLIRQDIPASRPLFRLNQTKAGEAMCFVGGPAAKAKR